MEKYKDIYTGGDNDVFEGFYNSDEELDFENFKKGKKAQQGGGLFGKLTDAFKNYTGNKVLVLEDVEPILKEFQNSLMEKNVAQEVAQ